MSETSLQSQLDQAHETIQLLHNELAETDRGLVALTLELEARVDARTADLREAHTELERTNSELVQLTLELDDRVAERTAELQGKTEELRSTSQQLWQAAKLATMGELAASIAHELNNPLGTLTLGIEELLSTTPADSPVHRELKIMEQETDRMARLVANLLQFSRPGHQQVSTFDVSVEIEKTLELSFFFLRKRAVAVVREFVPELPLVQGDRQQLRQVFLNLIVNASDAMSQGGTLTVRGFPGMLPDNKAAVVLEFADTGTGIPPELLPKVMEPFFTTKPVGMGTGLGLPICRRIVSEHRGVFEILSELHRGTLVRVVLPIANNRIAADEKGTEASASK